MAASIPLRPDFGAPRLRALAKHSRDPDQTRRLVALAAIYEGASRSEAAQIGCVTLQIVRDWVVRFNARGPQGLVTGRAPGSRPLLNGIQRQELQRMVDHGPIPSVHAVVGWRLVDLVQWVFDEFRITISKQTISRELRGPRHGRVSLRGKRLTDFVAAYNYARRLKMCAPLRGHLQSLGRKPVIINRQSAPPIARTKHLAPDRERVAGDRTVINFIR